MWLSLEHTRAGYLRDGDRWPTWCCGRGQRRWWTDVDFPEHVEPTDDEERVGILFRMLTGLAVVIDFHGWSGAWEEKRGLIVTTVVLLIAWHTGQQHTAHGGSVGFYRATPRSVSVAQQHSDCESVSSSLVRISFKCIQRPSTPKLGPILGNTYWDQPDSRRLRDRVKHQRTSKPIPYQCCRQSPRNDPFSWTHTCLCLFLPFPGATSISNYKPPPPAFPITASRSLLPPSLPCPGQNKQRVPCPLFQAYSSAATPAKKAPSSPACAPTPP